MKCTAVLPCEKIIIDKDGAHSIINVMLNAELTAQKTEAASATPEAIPIPVDAVAPIVWWIYTVWHPEPGDVGKTFDQVFQAFWPDGRTFMDTKLSFTLKDDTPMQTTFHVGGLPAGQVGQLKILTWLNYQGNPVCKASEAYMNIRHRASIASGQLPIIALGSLP